MAPGRRKLGCGCAVAALVPALLLAAALVSGGGGAGAGGSADGVAAAAEAEYEWSHQPEQVAKSSEQIASKYIDATGVGAQGAWCGAFASYCLQQGGLVDAGVAKCEGFHCAFADDVEADPSCGSVHDNDGKYTPQRGDLAIRCSSTDPNCKHYRGHSSGTGEHVEVVVGMTADGKVETIGGNTGNDTGNGAGNWVGRHANALGESWDVFVSYNAGSVSMSGPVAGKTVSIPAKHEHRACTGKGGCEKGAVRKTVGNLGSLMTLEFDYSKYTSIMTGATGDSDPEYKVYKLWCSTGKKTGQAGLPTIQGRYLVAVSPRFGDVGDYVTATLSNGKKIDCIVADTKNPDDTTAKYHEYEGCLYGHYYTSGQVSILEFMFSSSTNMSSGNASSLVGDWKGTYITAMANGGSAISKRKG